MRSFCLTRPLAAIAAALALVFAGGCDELLRSCLAVFTIEEFHVSPNPANAGQSVLVTWEVLNEETTYALCDVAVLTPGGTDVLVSDYAGSGSVSFTATQDATVAINCTQLCGDNEMKSRELEVVGD